MDTLLLSPGAYTWTVLTVTAGTGNVVARRRFTRDRDAEAVRTRFVDLAREVTDTHYASADWQSLLERA